MTPTPRDRGPLGPRFMAGVSTFAGLFGICMQFLRDTDLVTFMVALTGGLGLINIRSSLDEREHQLLYQAYGATFTGLFFALMIATGFLQVFDYLGVAQGVVGFLSTRWVGLMMSLMSLLLGAAGLRVFRDK